MKTVLFLLLSLMLPHVASCADKSQGEQSGNIEPEYIESDKLQIIVRTYDNISKNWLKLYQPSKDKTIPIDVEFNVDNVILVYITDVNAEKSHCGHYYPKTILYLYFKTPTNSKRINTLINKPCMYKRTATMRLKVITLQKEYLYREQTFPIHPWSSAQ